MPMSSNRQMTNSEPSRDRRGPRRSSRGQLLIRGLTRRLFRHHRDFVCKEATDRSRLGSDPEESASQRQLRFRGVESRPNKKPGRDFDSVTTRFRFSIRPRRTTVRIRPWRLADDRWAGVGSRLRAPSSTWQCDRDDRPCHCRANHRRTTSCPSRRPPSTGC
jgi:hypothetical protein